MYSIWSTIGLELPFTLLLLALLGFRRSVTPHASLVINAPRDKVFALVDVFDGKTENWGQTTIRADLVNPETQSYRKTYTTTMASGSPRSSSALFRIAERMEGSRLVLSREGLEGKSHNNELLRQDYSLIDEGDKTRLSMTYHWGPRPLIAQLLARADLWGGIYRLRSMAEDGRVSDRAYQLISSAVAVGTGIISIAAFAIVLGLPAAVLLVFALFVHELGHLIAYRLMGQPWGRMMFLPFLGAIAIPRFAFETQGQAVFAALMGPAFSTILAVACTLATYGPGTSSPFIAVLGLVTVGLNLFNLLPVEPLDGGVALRSVLQRLMGRHARFGLMIIGALIINIGFSMEQVILVIFGGLAILANLKDRTIDAGLRPLSSLQMAIAAFAYVAMAAAYITLLRHFLAYASLLQNQG